MCLCVPPRPAVPPPSVVRISTERKSLKRPNASRGQESLQVAFEVQPRAVGEVAWKMGPLLHQDLE